MASREKPAFSYLTSTLFHVLTLLTDRSLVIFSNLYQEEQQQHTHAGRECSEAGLDNNIVAVLAFIRLS